MSARYVYDIYRIDGLSTLDYLWTLQTSATYNVLRIMFATDYEASVIKTREGKWVTYFEAKGTTYNPGYNTEIALRVVDYPNIIVQLSTNTASGDVLYSECYRIHESGAQNIEAWKTGEYWHILRGTSSVRIWSNDSNELKGPDVADKKMLQYEGGTLEKGGTLIRTESSNSSSKTSGPYFQNNTYFWRDYKGSDTIDPLSVTYRENTLYKGEPVSVQIEARTPTYGGTISYQYQYSVDGGKTWTNAGSKTTETSQEITVPAEAKQFQARVLASDNYGFTSTTYVYGPASGVSQLKAYGGRDGKARSVLKMYGGVNGKARTVVKGYIGIGRKARKFL